MPDAPKDFDPPALLNGGHEASGFDSGEPSLDDWLRRHALGNLLAGASRTYVICPAGSARIAGYAALSMGQIFATETTGAMRRNIPPNIPAIVLGRLAIDRAWQAHGLGRVLLANAVQRALRASREVAARLIIVHAISLVAEAFYLHHGFVRLPVQAPTLALDLVRLRNIGE